MNPEDEYIITKTYKEAYDYFRECMMFEQEDYSRQKLLDMFLMHQYLNDCYCSIDTINQLAENNKELIDVTKIIRECFFCYRAVGAFQESVKQYELLRKSDLWSHISQVEQMQIMKEAAKAYRNMGDFTNALNLYYECLTQNPEQNWVQRVELLLKIGKVYRNYLMQIELASFYAEEAYRILLEKQTNVFSEKKEKRYAVICLDTLGQIYRDEGDFVKAREFFQKSKEIFGHKGSRAQVHEILMKYERNYEKMI